MKVYTKVFVKLAITLAVAAIAFYIGFIVTGVWYDRSVLPEVVKKYPHDGQVGLETFVYALNGACASAVIVLVSGIIWTVKTSKGPKPQTDGLAGTGYLPQLRDR